jgi:peptide/nickel transport system ATP-binding protein
MRIVEGIMEGLTNRGLHGREARRLAEEGMETCGLPKELADRYPHELSGGECQRASLARAIVVKPKLLICDEATSALDVTIQARIIELLRRLRKETSTSYLFISHDIALVREICDRALVMEQGRVVEEGTPTSSS